MNLKTQWVEIATAKVGLHVSTANAIRQWALKQTTYPPPRVSGVRGAADAAVDKSSKYEYSGVTATHVRAARAAS